MPYSNPFPATLALDPSPILPQKNGPKDPDPIYKNVGLALSIWEHLEEILARVFGHLLDAPYSAGLARAYGSILSSGSRIDMLKHVAEAKFMMGGEAYDHLNSALNKVGKLAARRNEIAHGRVKSIIVNGEDVGFFLFPSEYNSGKIRSPKGYWDEAEKLKNTEGTAFKFFANQYKYFYSNVEIAALGEMFTTVAKEFSGYEETLVSEMFAKQH